MLMRPNSLNAFCWVFCEGGVTFNVPERKDGEMLTERFLGNISNISGNCGLFKLTHKINHHKYVPRSGALVENMIFPSS